MFSSCSILGTESHPVFGVGSWSYCFSWLARFKVSMHICFRPSAETGAGSSFSSASNRCLSSSTSRRFDNTLVRFNKSYVETTPAYIMAPCSLSQSFQTLSKASCSRSSFSACRYLALRCFMFFCILVLIESFVILPKPSPPGDVLRYVQQFFS